MVEPLPLVPATWITGGSVRFGMIEPRQQAMHAIEAEIDALRMQGGQPRDQFTERLGIWRQAGSRVGRSRHGVRRRDDLGRVRDLRRRL